MSLGASKRMGSASGASAIEVGRGIAILSVIYGHALSPWFMGAGVHFSEAAFLQWKFGASFMMAFFFFLSGVGWRERKSLSTTFRQAVALILIAWLASAVYDFARLLAGVSGVAAQLGAQPLDASGFIDGLVRMAVVGDAYSLSALWFLVALALVRMLAALAVRAGPGASWALAALLLAATLAVTEYGWRNVYQLNLLGVAFGAFLIGHAARGFWTALTRNLRATFALFVLAGAATALTFHLNEGCRWDWSAQCGADWLNGHFGVSMIVGQYGNLALFTLTAATGVAFACALSILLARAGGALGRRLDGWGRNSLNLLIVNALFLHVGNDFVERFAVPRVAADNVLFFVALFGLTLAANLIAAEILARPLRRLFSIARLIARRMVDFAAQTGQLAIVSFRGLRVSQRHE